MSSLMQNCLGSWSCVLMKENSFKSSTTKLGGKKLQSSSSSFSSPLKISTQDNKTAQSLEETLTPLVLGRREAVGFGFSLSFINFFLQPYSTAAAETTSCGLTITPSGLAYCDRNMGTGPAAIKGQLIKAHYVGKLENGKVFDSSYKRGKPLTFRIGVGEVIKGWDQGILGGDGVPPMMSGGKRSLKIPPELAYGMRGAGCKGGTCIIPPNSVLLFDVEFVGEA